MSEKIIKAYPFLYEDSALCDYEIATDEFTSEIGVAMHHVKHFDLTEIAELVYHANGSMRGRMAISDDDYQRMVRVHDSLQQEIGAYKNFVLPTGSLGAAHLHVLRSRAKAMVRLLHKIDQEDGREKILRLHNFFNLLSNIFFLMALIENRNEGVAERTFVSKSY